MHIDLNVESPAELVAEVAIVGAGAAGITLARRLLAQGRSVLLLESGGLDHEADSAALNEGANVGQDYYPLADARLRFFGGTTAIWGGRCSQLDPIDFERRSWVPHSGWPFGAETIAPYYREARQAFGLPADTADAAALGDAVPAFDSDALATPLWSFDDRFDRFSFANCRDVVDHPRATIVTHATVREVMTDPSARSVEGLEVVNLRGHELRVRASYYVLAAGGIENPRLLLASRSVMAAGLGNGHDQVGRYFMEHPHARGGRITGGAAWRLLSAFGKRTAIGADLVAPLIALAPKAQEREGALNTSLTIAGRRPADGRQPLLMRAYNHAKHKTAPTKGGRTLWKAAKQTVRVLQRATDPLRPWLLHRLGMLDVALVVRAEQAPNPASRVLLDRECDASGVQRVKLDWRTTALDTDSVASLVATLGQESERLGLGTVEPAPWLSDPSRAWATDELISTHAIGGYHHMGTTRMSANPRHGVTDDTGRVHGIDNLFVAGSSLFPTSGWANPTLTIAALAMRTADIIGTALTMDRWPLRMRFAQAAE